MSCEHAAELVQQYEALRQYALNPVGVCPSGGLMVLLRSGMATWIRSQLARPQLSEPTLSHPLQPHCVTTVHRDWVLALAALVLGQSDHREVRHG